MKKVIFCQNNPRQTHPKPLLKKPQASSISKLSRRGEGASHKVNGEDVLDPSLSTSKKFKDKTCIKFLISSTNSQIK